MKKLLSALLLSGLCAGLFAQSKTPKLSSEKFVHLYGNLNNTFYHIKKKKQATVAFLGGSITQNPGWKEKTVQYLEQTYPETKFNFIYAGISSLGSVPHSFRLQRDVLDKGKPDLLFVETAVNDLANKTPAAYQHKAMEGIIRHALSANPYMNIVLMAFVDEPKIADYENGKVPAEVGVHDQFAAFYHLPFLNLAKEVQERIRNKEFTWKDDFKDLHPSPFGQELYFQTIKALLQKSDKLYKGQALQPFVKKPTLYKGIFDNGAYVKVQEAKQLNNFKVVDNWRPADAAGTRAGFVEVPILEGVTAGASFTFSFTGNAVGICIVSGPDAGIIKYTIDGKAVQKTDLYTEWSKQLHLPWYVVLADELGEGQHELTVEIASEKNIASLGNACRIVHLLVNH